jgi:hydroxyethylthiazole kinase-like uncharacterized protein yjeF
MRRADRRTIDEIGLPGPVLMENAGAAVARAIADRFGGSRRVAVLCGRGNNGGDGFVVARRLGDRARALLIGAKEGVAGEARVHLLACERSGVPVRALVDEAGWEEALTAIADVDLVVDAVLGTGLRAAPVGLAAAAVAWTRARRAAGVPVVAVDLPSGVPTDGGAFDWPAVQADLTVTFAALKRGHVLPPAAELAGEVVVADIGISKETIEACSPSLFLLQDEDAAAAFPRRPRGAHKGDFGHVLVVAGSIGKAGAAALAAGGALRGGAGLVTVATPAPCLPTVAAARAEAMTVPVDATPAGAFSEDALAMLLELASARDAVVLGPGIGREPATRRLVRAFVRACPVPIVVDADGLDAVAPSSAGDREGLAALRRGAPTVLTPHPGEMARLTGKPTSEVQASRPETALALARETGAVVVLKGERTVVADPVGRAAVCPAGNPGMATGGTGDVLAGLVGALLARHGALLAATAAVVVHARAGDLAARRSGEDGMTAGDVVEALPAAVEAVRSAGGARSVS